MKIKTGATIKQQPHEVDLKELYENYLEKYGQVFMHDFGEAGVFIFKCLGRKDFRELRDSETINDYAKEEVICEYCVLYPKGYDFENCEEAGLPTQLANIILEKSLLKDSTQLKRAVHYFRDQIFDSLDDQITCIIHEAFPEFPIEEIANWNVMKTAEYMAKAEYILHSLRGVPIMDDKGNAVEYVRNTEQQPIQAPPQKHAEQMQTMEERFKSVDAVTAPSVEKPQQRDEILKPKRAVEPPKPQPVKNGKDQQTRLQQLRHLQEVAPIDAETGMAIDWANDSVMKMGMKAFQGFELDDTPVAEREIDEDVQDLIPEALRDRFKAIRKV